MYGTNWAPIVQSAVCSTVIPAPAPNGILVPSCCWGEELRMVLIRAKHQLIGLAAFHGDSVLKKTDRRSTRVWKYSLNYNNHRYSMTTHANNQLDHCSDLSHIFVSRIM